MGMGSADRWRSPLVVTDALLRRIAMPRAAMLPTIR